MRCENCASVVLYTKEEHRQNVGSMDDSGGGGHSASAGKSHCHFYYAIIQVSRISLTALNCE